METSVNEPARTENDGLNSQSTHENTAHFTQNVPQYTQAGTVTNGNDVGIAQVPQTIDSSQEQSETLAEDVGQAGMNIANVPVQVAVGSVAVSSADGSVSVVDGTSVERTEDGAAHGGAMVTSLPPEYLQSHLAQQYVMQGSPTDGKLLFMFTSLIIDSQLIINLLNINTLVNLNVLILLQIISELLTFHS